jgi:quercetin dioxygenase-like cupin family protein
VKKTLLGAVTAIVMSGALVGGWPAIAQDDAPQPAPLVMNWKTAEWGPPSPARPGFPAGLRNSQIGTDPTTGGPTYLARFPAGSRFEMHWHTYAETAVVMEGSVDIILDGIRHTATEGSYIVIPGKAHHEWIVPEEADVVLLARRDGPADFHFVEP